MRKRKIENMKQIKNFNELISKMPGDLIISSKNKELIDKIKD